jgi:hypothetical protein
LVLRPNGRAVPAPNPSEEESPGPNPPVDDEGPVGITTSINPDAIGTVADGPAVWQFELSNLGEGAGEGRIWVTFEKAGEISVGPSRVNPETQRFEITLQSWGQVA